MTRGGAKFADAGTKVRYRKERGLPIAERSSKPTDPSRPWRIASRCTSDPFDESVRVGPLASLAQRDRVAA
jgi:hypothetical protein